jgi:hypothetical protein
MSEVRRNVPKDFMNSISWTVILLIAAMEKTETKIVDSRLPNVHYPSKEELREHTQRLIDNRP